MRKIYAVIVLMGMSSFSFAGAYDFTNGPASVHTEGESSDGTAWSTTTTGTGGGFGAPYSETTVGEDSNGNAWMSTTR